MTATVKRMALTLGAGLIAAGVSAGAYVHAQDGNTTPQPPPFRRGMGPGGPGRFGGPGGRGGGPMGMLPMFGPRLGLTETQRDQIKAIADAHQDEWKALAERGRAAHVALEQAITTPGVNEALVRQKSAEAGAVEADLAVARARAFADAWPILTAEQQTRLRER